jgi:hypothetical protein
VLNLFSYTGGFSVYAGAAGAGHVTSVDLAAPAIASAGANWALNGLDPGRHAGAAADCFEFLDGAAAAGEAWDVVGGGLGRGSGRALAGAAPASPPRHWMGFPPRLPEASPRPCQRQAHDPARTFPLPSRQVIVDPPSFAPSKQSVPKATASYERVFAKAAAVTAP